MEVVIYGTLQPRFPVENFNFKNAIDFADPAECNVLVKRAETYNITKCVHVSIDSQNI